LRSLEGEEKEVLKGGGGFIRLKVSLKGCQVLSRLLGSIKESFSSKGTVALWIRANLWEKGKERKGKERKGKERKGRICQIL